MKYILSVIFAGVFFVNANAQVPGTLSYQGILVKSDGTPVTDGNHTVLFNFYKVESGGVPIFVRGPITVTTYKGMFTLLLGTGTPATVNDPLPVLASDANYIGDEQFYIELVADNVILTPRVQLSSVPYAFSAQNANSMDAAGLSGTANLPNTVLDTDLQDLADGSLTGSKVGTGINAANITSNTVAIANGGTNANTAAGARTNLGLGTISTVSAITSTEITDGSIVNADVNAAAGIVDTKLATISTAGKVSGGAITSGTIGGSTSFNTSGTVVTSVGSGNAISGTSSSTAGGAGVYGVNTSSSTAAVGIYGYAPSLSGTGAKGIWGYAPSGIGVEGQSGSSYGLYGYSDTGIGVYGTTSTSNYAGYFDNNSSGSAYGAKGEATGATCASCYRYGVMGYAYYGQYNYALYADAYSGVNNYGVYSYGGAGSGVNYAGYFVGTVYTSATYTGSDQKLKKDIKPLTSGLDLVMRLKPSTYLFRDDGEYKRMNLPSNKHFGLIAQDVETVIPSIVSENVHPAEVDRKTKAITSPEIQFKGLNYSELIPILIKAIQEQQAQIESMKAEIEILKKK